MDKKVTIYDIAREAGVSTATVTRVLKGVPNVKPDTRERVQRIIDANAYTPSASATALRNGSSLTLAIVMPSVSNPYFARVYTHAYQEAQAHGYYLSLFQLPDDQPVPSDLIDEIIRRRMDGVLFVGGIWSTDRSDLNDALTRLKHHMPIAVICPPSIERDCICIHSDVVSCSRLPVRHLHALGHRRIAFVGGSTTLTDGSMRGINFIHEMEALGLPDNPAYHINTGFDAESGERSVLRMLSGLPRAQWPTAIIAFNDLVAFGVMKQLKKMGLHIPEDIAIIGCDNLDFCSYVDPPLTSVDLHTDEMVQSAIRELLSARDNNSPSISLMHEASLVIRESCGTRLGYRKMD